MAFSASSSASVFVRVDPLDWERELADHLVERLQHPDGRLVRHRPVDRPAGGDVGGGEGEPDFPGRVATLVADQVDLDELGPGVVPLGPGPHRQEPPPAPKRSSPRAGVQWREAPADLKCHTRCLRFVLPVRDLVAVPRQTGPEQGNGGCSDPLDNQGGPSRLSGHGQEKQGQQQ